MNMGRLVVLLHRVGPAMRRTEHDHLDWMIDTGGPGLVTFATEITGRGETLGRRESEAPERDRDTRNGDRDARDGRPVAWDGRPVAAVRLPDHRRRYLTYQGPLSDDRGEVRRVAAATVRWRTNSNQLLHRSTPVMKSPAMDSLHLILPDGETLGPLTRVRQLVFQADHNRDGWFLSDPNRPRADAGGR